MKDRKAFKRWLIPLGSGLLVSLAGCSGNFAVLDPKGSVGVAEKSLILTATWAMLLVVVPVIILTLLFAWRYRASKWLFIDPDLGIATVNQLAVPVGTPVNFSITSDSVMNSFFIPQLGPRSTPWRACKRVCT